MQLKIVDQTQFVFNRHTRLLNHSLEETVVGIPESQILDFCVFANNVRSLVNHRVILKMSLEIKLLFCVSFDQAGLEKATNKHC